MLRADLNEMYLFENLSPATPAMVTDTRYGAVWHTAMKSEQRQGSLQFIDAEENRRDTHTKELSKLEYLKGKLLRKCKGDNPIFVIKCNNGIPERHLGEVFQEIQRICGGNDFSLLEVCESEALAGTVEQIAPHLMRGYVNCLAPYHASGDVDLENWLNVMRAALRLSPFELQSMNYSPTKPCSDLAFSKPARTSSVSRWSKFQDPALDAGGANGPDLPADYGFHTDAEDNPWWMVDLLDEYLVEEVAIVNRPDYEGRFTSFTILSSRDGVSWRTRYLKLAPEWVSSDGAEPWRIHLSDPFLARYVKIMVPGVRQILHLRRVQIYGRALAAPMTQA
jgi:hypothetical protein